MSRNILRSTLTLLILVQSAVAMAASPAGLTAAQVIRGGKLTVNGPDGRPLQLHGDSRSPAPDLYGLLARSDAPQARLYAFVAAGTLRSADLYFQGRHYTLERQGQGYWRQAQAEERAGSVFPEPTVPAVRRATPVAEAAVAGPNAAGLFEIRVMVLYSEPVLARFGDAGTVATEAQRQLFLANAAYELNSVPVTLLLTEVRSFAEVDPAEDFHASIDRMAASTRVRAWRDANLSDLVVLFRDDSGGGLCGLSSGFNGLQPGDEADNVDPERDAYNVVAVSPQPRCGAHTLAHEIGHSLAAGHDYVTSGGYSYWKPYAHAMACQGETVSGYFSLMWGAGASLGIHAGEPGGRTDVMTNPDALFDGRVCGMEGVDGVPASQANNVRVMTEAAPYVAAYRPEPAAAARADSAARPQAGALHPIWLLAGVLAGLWRRRRLSP